MIRPGIFFRGMAMGAADVVPGVSGGTLALITGIYEELIDTLGGLTPRLLKVWHQQGFVAFWRQANLTFLVTLLAGIFTSIAVLARLITWLLETHPVPVWAFFSGLILASIFLVLKPLQQRGAVQIAAFVAGTGVAVAIGLAPALSAVGSGETVFFFSGMLAICAMILPGISGSFILLLLGMYQPVLEAVKQGEIPLLLAFMAGCAIGLLSFVHVLKWTLHRYHDTVMALLAGFMAGSLLKLWPWRVSGEQGLADRWLSPAQYASETGDGSQLALALLAGLVAATLVWLLYRLAPVHNVAQDS
jgi:putative membrane protein